ncbi:MAG: hypothetical protein A3G80_00455 [Betaproteobacteria bacterium RIFCSPLOWO2_12_FULL_62_13b]|nr:MAG: hypothetical protein A3G80_00455 [Betaproteobacteria bacterium RIFCSPLOWO2_12_FULL_62_13b]
MTRAQSAGTLLVAAAAIWALAHPYEGIRHDGALYLAQALLHLRPEVFASDLFFAYGSQDSFSLFSRLHAWALEWLGVGAGTRVLLVAAQLSFAALSAVLLRRLLDGTLFWFGLAMVFSYFPFYGGWSIFSYGEPFVTARSFAEPLSILALVLLMDGRPKSSLAVIAVAALIHPLIAITTGCFWWIYQALRDSRWWWLALSLLGGPLLALFDLQHLPSIWQRYDDAWWQVVATRDAFVLPTRWTRADWTYLAADALVVLFAIALASGRRKQFLVAALVTGLLGVAAAVVGADLMRNVLVTGLQLWRTHWILHFVAVAMLPFVAYELWKRPGTGRATAALLVTAFVSTRFPGSLGAMALAIALYLSARRGFQLSASTEKLLLAVCALIVAVAAAQQLDLRMFGSGNGAAAAATGWRLAATGLSHPLMAVLVIWGLLHAVAKPMLRPLAAICALAMGALAIGVWDQRTPWLKFVEAGAVADRPFAGLIKPGEQVLWHGDMLATWLVLSRPSWYSFMQGTGVLFNRNTALEFDRRKSVVAVLETQEQTCMMLAGLSGTPGDCSPDLEAVQSTCREAGDLDFIVIRSAVETSAAAEWTFTDPESNSAARFHLYDCRRLIGG